MLRKQGAYTRRFDAPYLNASAATTVAEHKSAGSIMGTMGISA
jgi:hypothetical protein